MYNVYPYSAAHAIVKQSKFQQATDSFTRIKTELSGKEHAAVQSTLHTLEAHVLAVNTNRLQQALQAEQVRLANAGRPGSIGRKVMTFRRSIGNTLIAIGEKLHNQPVTRTPRTRTA